MAKLYFRYGAMNCGKTTALIQVAHNYHERNMQAIIIKPATDTKGYHEVVSRIGTSRKVDYLINSDQDITQLITAHQVEQQIDCLLVDEAQFFAPTHIEQLFSIAVEYNIPVICYGLRADFQTKAFPGSVRLFELAHSLEELKTICRCGQKALFNGRMVNDTFTNQGDQIAIDNQNAITYESLCAHCYLNKVGLPQPSSNHHLN